ncbi:MAG: DUF4911 domain-containing protein [Smithellaceae bacterium]
MIRKLFKLKTSDITLVQFIIEGYEGLATVSTLDPKGAVIQVMIMADFVHDMNTILDDLKSRFQMEELF